jgi:hypothetical protein
LGAAVAEVDVEAFLFGELELLHALAATSRTAAIAMADRPRRVNAEKRTCSSLFMTAPQRPNESLM